MRIFSRQHFRQGMVSNEIYHCCRLMFIGIVILQAWPNECILQKQTSQSNTTMVHSYEPVGCFKDKRYRRVLPVLVKLFPDMINETDLASSYAAIIHECAGEVYKNGFWYFGVEYRYQCWSGINRDMNYSQHGRSNNCLLNYGVGATWTIFVYRFVEVNGSWSHWSPWQPCSVTCGGGNRTRNRTCSNPAPKWNGMDCPGTNISTETCNLHNCKVNGSWSQWFLWQPCSVTCGGGNRTRFRTCSNPAPKWNGMDCPGTNISTESCNLHKCKVNGSWSHWSLWRPCSVTCGGGNRTRTRTCSNPAPKWNGQNCPGTNISTGSCNLQKCRDTTVLHPYEPVGCFKDNNDPRALSILIQKYPINNTDLANSFADIIHACATEVFRYGLRYFGVEYRHECWSGANGGVTYNRHGRSENCLSNYGVGSQWTIFVYRFVEVNGSWSQWSSWQPCSVTCGGGHRARARTCSNPAPKWNGTDCPGRNISTERCDLHKCKDSTEGNILQNNETYHGQSTGKSSLPLVATIVGGSLLALLCLSGVLWFALRHRSKSLSKTELFQDPWEVLFDDISLNRVIGEGAFGKVYSGRLLKQTMEDGKARISSRRKTDKKEQEMKMGLNVAVKMLQNGATEEQIQEFLEEILLMKQIGYHPNILNLLACCTMTNPMFLVVEFAKNGDLLHYLRKRREQIKQTFEATGEAAPQLSRHQNMGVKNEGPLYECTSNKNETLVVKTDPDNLDDDDALIPADLMTFAWQIAKGMEFLSRKGFVHRDLAARNVLVCDGKLVKVADFGLSRNVYVGKMYHSTKTRKLPLKWMSPEAIHDQVFNAESDVWAYGILLWEIFTIGGTPYPTISNHKLFGALKAGYRMDQPQMCSDEMYELMRQCWKENPAERPSFTAIQGQLERMMLHQCPYLDMADAKYSYAPCYDVDSDKETELESSAV